MKIFTIGHSTRTQEELIALLRKNRVNILVDVRYLPRSRYNPQFNSSELGKVLPLKDITYIHFPALGGLRKPKPGSVNTGWRVQGFQGFADYMQTPQFEEGMKQLLKIARGGTVALMCAEAIPAKCHRNLLSDALVVRGWKVHHINSATEVVLHQLTDFAKVEGRKITYPAPAGEQPSLEF